MVSPMFVQDTYIAPPARMTSTLRGIPPGVDGVIATLDEMVRLSRASKKLLPVRMTAMQAIQHIPGKAYREEARAIQKWVRDRIRYTKDVRGIETLADPERTLELGQGDCDDKSLLVSALLESVGHPTRFVAVAFRPGMFEHVYVETKIGKEWVPVETTEPVEFGWKPRGIVGRIVRNV